MAKKSSGDKDVLRVPVAFGNFASGDETCRLGARIDAGAITQAQANKYLCGARIKVELSHDPNAGQDGPGQTKAFKDELIEVQGVADVKAYTRNPKRYGFGLTFNLQDVDAGSLMHLSKKSGTIEMERTGDATERKRGRPAKSDADPNQATFEDGEDDDDDD